MLTMRMEERSYFETMGDFARRRITGGTTYANVISEEIPISTHSSKKKEQEGAYVSFARFGSISPNRTSA